SASDVKGPIVRGASNRAVKLDNLPKRTAGTKLNVYRTKAGGVTFYLVGTIVLNTKTTYVDGKGDDQLTVRRDGRAAPDVAKFDTKLGTEDIGGRMAPGDYDYKVVFNSDAGMSFPSDPVAVTLAAVKSKLTLLNIPVGPEGTTGRRIFRKLHTSNGPYKLVDTLDGNRPGSFTD